MKWFSPFILLMVLTMNGCATAPSQQSQWASARSIDGSSIAYETRGTGDKIPVLFIHCWTCDKEFWSAQVREVSRTRPTVTLDLAGHGQSGKSRVDYEMSKFGQDIVAVVEALKLQEVILVGHSMGGPAAIEAARLLGSKVRAIVGVENFYADHPMPSGKMRKDLLAGFDANFPNSARQLMEGMFPTSSAPVADMVISNAMRADARISTNALRHIFDWYEQDLDRRLAEMDDRIWTINGDWKGNQLNHPRERIVSGAGHFPAQEKPQAFNSVLLEVLTEIEGKARLQ